METSHHISHADGCHDQRTCLCWGLMTAMFHDYRIMNPHKGFLCLNELDFGASLNPTMVSVFRIKLGMSTFRNMVLESRRYPALEALKEGIVDGLGALMRRWRSSKNSSWSTRLKERHMARSRKSCTERSSGISTKALAILRLWPPEIRRGVAETWRQSKGWTNTLLLLVHRDQSCDRRENMPGLPGENSLYHHRAWVELLGKSGHWCKMYLPRQSSDVFIPTVRVALL